MLCVLLTNTKTPCKKKKEKNERYTSDAVLKMKYSPVVHGCIKFYCPTDLQDTVGALLDWLHLAWASG